MTWSDVRAAANSPRANVVAIVGCLSALGGAVAGGVAALIAAAVLTPSEPVSAAQIALMAIGYGFVAGLAGSVLGTIVAFGALRRVPLGRLILCTNVGLAAGLTAGWLGGPWAWHHMGFLGCVGFSAGALLARAVSRGSPVPSASLPFDSVPANGTIPSEPHGVVPTLTSPVELAAPARLSDSRAAQLGR
jgi:MFS family permease